MKSAQPTTHSLARDVFGNLLAFGTLYTCVVSFMALLFQYVNVKFPDALSYSYVSSLDTIRACMAVLIVVWPVFLVLSWLLAKGASGKISGLKKWLVYLTLTVTAVSMMVDLVTLVNYFLNGEITTRFILKVLIVLLTSAGVFGYYLWDLRRDVSVKTKLPLIAAIKDSVILVAVIILGFVLVGSPAQQRAVRFDEQRVNDLSTIQNEVINYYSNKHSLPASLSDLSNSLNGFIVPVDPETSAAYEYRDSLGDATAPGFALCATFATNNSTSNDVKTSQPTTPRAAYDLYNSSWSHITGQVCFERTIDPSMFPVTK